MTVLVAVGVVAGRLDIERPVQAELEASLGVEIVMGYTVTVPEVSFGDDFSILGCSIRLVKDVQ